MQENNQNTENAGDSENGQFGPIAGIILVIAVLAIGGFYFFGKEVSERTSPSVEEILGAPDQSLESLQAQGTSDELSAIEEDVTATNLDNLGAELNTIESELNF